MSKFFVHSSSFVDEGVEIGEGTKIWHLVTYFQDQRLVKLLNWSKCCYWTKC